MDETVQGPPTVVNPTIKPVAARGFSLAVTPKRDRKAPYKFKTSLTVPRKGSLSITATFAGNARITAVSAQAVKVRAG